MTGYYTEVMLELRKRTGLRFSAFYDSTDGLDREIDRMARVSSSVLLLSDLLNTQVNDGTPFIGSRTLRDPRDLAVSGYFYHLRSNEEWLSRTDFKWEKLTDDPCFAKWFDLKFSNWCGKSYSEVLKSMSQKDGIALEIVRIAPCVRKMEKITMSDKSILQINFEQIVGNEVASFSKFFQHYQLNPKYLNAALETVEVLSAHNRRKCNPHIRATEIGEWTTVLDTSHKNLIDSELRLALINGGYSP